MFGDDIKQLLNAISHQLLMNQMFKIILSCLTNFINIKLIKKNTVNLLTLIKCYDGHFIFTIDLNMFLILITRCPLKYYKNSKLKFNVFVFYLSN
jgi:hypothetical protein